MNEKSGNEDVSDFYLHITCFFKWFGLNIKRVIVLHIRRMVTFEVIFHTILQLQGLIVCSLEFGKSSGYLAQWNSTLPSTSLYKLLKFPILALRPRFYYTRHKKKPWSSDLFANQKRSSGRKRQSFVQLPCLPADRAARHPCWRYHWYCLFQ